MSRKSSNSNEIELRIALENRAFEIQLFWQRSNYFIVLMTALGIGVFTIEDSVFSLLISLFASVTSWYWYNTNLGSKFWQESWEVEVVNLAKDMKISSFERSTVDIIDQVTKSLESARPSDSNAWYRLNIGNTVRKLIDRQIVKKPSVSHYMILLSLTSFALWSIVSILIFISLFGVSLTKQNVERRSPEQLIVSQTTHAVPPVDNDSLIGKKGGIVSPSKETVTPSATNSAR